MDDSANKIKSIKDVYRFAPEEVMTPLCEKIIKGETVTEQFLSHLGFDYSAQRNIRQFLETGKVDFLYYE